MSKGTEVQKLTGNRLPLFPKLFYFPTASWITSKKKAESKLDLFETLKEYYFLRMKSSMSVVQPQSCSLHKGGCCWLTPSRSSVWLGFASLHPRVVKPVQTAPEHCTTKCNSALQSWKRAICLCATETAWCNPCLLMPLQDSLKKMQKQLLSESKSSNL